MRPLRIAIVGVGYRGLSALERIISHSNRDRVPVDVLLIEPGELGPGTHSRHQPEYLLLNTVASQVTAFSDERMVPDAPVTTGPSFLEWCVNRGVRPHAWRNSSTNPALADSFLPRRLLGDYLAWAAEQLLSELPSWIKVTRSHSAATDVRPTQAMAEVRLDDGSIHTVDLALITTGHGLPRSHAFGQSPPRLVEHCYPLPDTIAELPATRRVGIAGAGLAALDVVAALTVGRGGEFWISGDRLCYQPSGNEPSLLLFNRSGWLANTRPTHPRVAPSLDAKHLTLDALDELRSKRADRRIEFVDLERLVRAEILDEQIDPRQRRRLTRALATQPDLFLDIEEYRSAALDQARWDLTEGARDLEASPAKDALETLRDLREVLRAAVDDPGMTHEGHREFFSVIPRLANRTAVGPTPRQLSELLALIDAGVVTLGPGPDPTLERDGTGWRLRSTCLEREDSMTVDTVVLAHLEFPSTDVDTDPLAQSIRSWAQPHSGDTRYLGLTREGYLRARGGEVCFSIACFGPPAEGSSYYNNYVLWPGVWSRLLTDLDKVIAPRFQRSSLHAQVGPACHR